MIVVADFVKLAPDTEMRLCKSRLALFVFLHGEELVQ